MLIYSSCSDGPLEIYMPIVGWVISADFTQVYIWWPPGGLASKETGGITLPRWARQWISQVHLALLLCPHPADKWNLQAIHFLYRVALPRAQWHTKIVPRCLWLIFSLPPWDKPAPNTVPYIQAGWSCLPQCLADSLKFFPPQETVQCQTEGEFWQARPFLREQ